MFLGGLNLPPPPLLSIPCERRFLFLFSFVVVVVVVCFFFPPKIKPFFPAKDLPAEDLSQAKEFALPLELPSKKLPQRQAIKLT